MVMSQDNVEKLEHLLCETNVKLQTFHEEFAVFRARIESLVNGGPGKSPHCGMQDAAIAEIRTKLDAHSRFIWSWSAGLAIAVFAIGLFGPAIRHVLKLP